MTEAHAARRARRRHDYARECFLMAPIGEPGSAVRRRSDDVRDYVVTPAVERLGLEVVRVDEVDEPGQITRQIVEHVLRARAAVADLTGANPNVYYELGVRHSAGLPLVLIAEEDEIAQLPFDLIQMRVIGFRHDDLRSVDRAKDQIAAQMSAALEGAVDSPVATVRALDGLSHGSDVEQALASLAKTVDVLSRSTLETNVIVKRLAAGTRGTRPYELVAEQPDRWVLRFRTSDGNERIELPVRPTPEEIEDLIAAAQERANAYWSGAAVEDPDEAARVYTAENVIRARILERAEREATHDPAAEEE